MSARLATVSGFAISLLLASGCKVSSGDGDTSNTDAAYDEGTGLGEGECAGMCGTPGCGSCPEATMVDGGGFQIDATEVDNAQFALLLEVEFDASVLPPGCDWKSGFEPDEWSDSLDPTLPVVGVDWCDAAVFCGWAGKQLCGAVGGGSSDINETEDPELDGWFRACTNGGTSDYPYGSAYDPAACNGDDSGIGALHSVGSLATCEGGAAGLFDMVGNVWEWSDACETSPGDANTECQARGGSRFSDAESVRCDGNSRRERGERDHAVGFRCCAG